MTDSSNAPGSSDLDSEFENELDAGSSMETGTLPAHPAVTGLTAALGEAFVLRHEVVSGDQHVVWVPADEIVRILRWLKETPEHGFDLLADVSAVDYGGGRPLEIYYQLWSIPNRRALRVKCTLPLEALEIDSVTEIWNAANWLEREVFDLFGIRFRNHPDLRRILMPDHYAEGHPLRKDFPLRGRFSRAEQTRRALSQELENYYIPEEMVAGGEPLRVESERQEKSE